MRDKPLPVWQAIREMVIRWYFVSLEAQKENIMYKTTPDDTAVLQIANINITGNILPPAWLKNLTFENGKPYTTAALILSDIVYWYRPVVIRDETTGLVTGLGKKFRADKLQRNYESLAEMYGFTKRQVTDACHYLAEQGLIDLDFRTIIKDGIKNGNVLFIGLNVERLAEITNVTGITLQRDRVSRFDVIGITPKRETNTENTPEINNTKDNLKGPDWDGLNLGASNVEITGAEIVLPQQEPIKAQFDNGKLSPGRGAPPDPWQEPPAVTQPLQPEPKSKRGKAKKPVEPITFALPDPINTPQVIQLLNDFEANRREIGKPMTQRAANMLVESISDLCIPEIVVRLRTAITRNWLGVRFPGDDYQYAQYRNGGNGNGRAYTNGATKQNGQQTAVKTWKPGGSY